MTDYTICDDWGEGSGLELHEKSCNEDQIGKKLTIIITRSRKVSQTNQNSSSGSNFFYNVHRSLLDLNIALYCIAPLLYRKNGIKVFYASKIDCVCVWYKYYDMVFFLEI